MRKFTGALALLSLALSLAAATAPKRPKLVVALVIDQFRYDYLLRFRNDYNSGLDRLLKQGAVFADAHYMHAFTVTAIGHSTFLSGAPPSVSGIAANEWYDRESKKTITSVSDPAAKLIGAPQGEETGSSPRRLLVTTVADEIKLAGIPSKSIGVSLKDRSAILPIGRMGDGAYWYDAKKFVWVTSDYYRKDLPSYAKAINDREPYKQIKGLTWLPFDSKGSSATPFCSMTKTDKMRYCGELEASPWGNELIEEFAENAMDTEELGKHEGTDVLAVSFSSNDYVGHKVGPNDPAVRDIAIRVDRLIGKLLTHIDQKIGPGNALVVLTADHGVATLPEFNKNANAGRIDKKKFEKRMSDALTQRFGAGEWIQGNNANMPYLNQELIHSKKLNPDEVENVAAEAALTEPHIARVFTRHQLLNGQVPADNIGRAFQLSFNAQRSGDLMILQEPGYLFEATGTSHGTPYSYDTHVPMIFMGAGVKPGIYRDRVAPNDIAPTLSTLLGIQEPSGSIGHVLAEIMQ